MEPTDNALLQRNTCTIDLESNIYRIKVSQKNKHCLKRKSLSLQTAFARVHAISLFIALASVMIAHAVTLDGIRTGSPLADKSSISAAGSPNLRLCDLGSKYMPQWVTTLLCGGKMQHGASRLMQEGRSHPVILAAIYFRCLK